MNKFKKIVLGALSALTLGLFVAVGTRVSAKGTTGASDVFNGDLSSMTSSIKTVSAKSNNSDRTMTFTTVSGKSGITGVTDPSNYGVTATAGAKLDGSGALTFTTSNSWSAEIYYAFAGTSSKTQGIQTNNGTLTMESGATTKNVLYRAEIASGTSGNVSLTRTGDKETWIFKIVVTESYNVKTFDINYNVGDHGVAPAKVEDKTSLTSSELAALSDDGDWAFNGWYMDSSFTIPATTSVNLDDYDVDGDVILYADWANANAKYTVSFDSNGGSAVSSVDLFYDENEEATLGNNMPANPTKTGYRFAGWYTSGDVRVLASTVLKADTTLYAKWVSSNQSSFSFDSYSNYSALPTDNTDAYDEITLSDKVALVSGHGKSSSSKFTFSDNSEYTKYFQNANTKLTLTTSTKVTIYATQTGNKETHNRQLVIMDDQLNRLGYYLLDKTNVSNPSTYSIVLGAGEYNLLAYKNDLSETDGYFNLYAITFEEFETSPSVVFNCQYDTTNPAEATKIRFIATMDGIVDPLLIDSVTFTITVGDDAQEFKCTKLYSSLSNKYSELGSGDGRVYAVYALSGIDTVIASGNVSFASLSVTVNFTAASGLESITANHDGFTLGSYE